MSCSYPPLYLPSIWSSSHVPNDTQPIATRPPIFILPPPSFEQTETVIQEIFKRIQTHCVWRDLTRTGECSLEIFFNTEDEDSSPIFEGFAVTQTLVQEIQSRLRCYFSCITLTPTFQSDLKPDWTSLRFKLFLCPFKTMPELLDTATETEKDLCEYMQAAIEFYRNDQASKKAAEHILKELNPQTLAAQKVICLIREFPFNPSVLPTEPFPEALKELSIQHQIPAIKQILERELQENELICSISIEAGVDGFQPGIFKITLYDPNKVSVFHSLKNYKDTLITESINECVFRQHESN